MARDERPRLLRCLIATAEKLFVAGQPLRLARRIRAGVQCWLLPAQPAPEFTATNPDVNRALDDLAARLHDHSLTIWCGAGVSIPSGLPGAQELVKELLACTALQQSQQDKIASIVPSRLPFERMMEVVLDTMDEAAQRRFLTLFSHGQPSLVHRFIAELAHRRLLKIVVTTNFDPHIEDAVSELVAGKDYIVHHDIDSLGSIDWNSDVLQILKLHGSVEDPTRLAVTVRRVAHPGSVNTLTEAVEQVFRASEAGGVVFLGYSFSDRFDISPAIQACSSKGCNAHVTVVRHAEQQPLALERGDPSEGRLLQGFSNRTTLQGDTGAVVVAIAERVGVRLTTENVEHEAPSESWRSVLRQALTDIDTRNANLTGSFLAGALLVMIGADREAIPYLSGVVARAKALGPQRSLAATQSLAGALNRAGDFKAAESALDEAQAIAQGFEGGRHLDHVLALRASLLQQVADRQYTRALDLYQEALALAQRTDDGMRCVPHLSGLAACWMKLGDLTAARHAYERALPIVDASGDLYRKAELHGNIASLALVMGDLESADKWYSEAERESRLAGDDERIGVHLMNRAIVLAKRERFADSLMMMTEARTLLEGVVWDGHPTLLLLEQHQNQVQASLDANSKPE